VQQNPVVRQATFLADKHKFRKYVIVYFLSKRINFVRAAILNMLELRNLSVPCKIETVIKDMKFTEIRGALSYRHLIRVVKIELIPI
jgi:hypothetical protein